MALILSQIPGFANLPDTVLEAEDFALGVHLNRISSNAAFGMVRCEVFTGTYKHGETVQTPVSAHDQYVYSRAECMYLWTFSNTANTETGWASYREPWTMWFVISKVDQSTGEVSCGVGYRGNQDHLDRQAPIQNKDGVLQVFTIAQRQRTGLVIDDILEYADITTAGATDDPFTQELAQGLNQNAKFAALNGEVVYMGEYLHGQTVARPVSPADGYQYEYSEVQWQTSLRWTADGTTTPTVPNIEKGQLQDWSSSVNGSGVVTVTVTYELNGQHAYNVGRIAVFAFCTRATGTELPTADDFAELPFSTFQTGQTERVSRVQQLINNIREAAFSPEFFIHTGIGNGDTVPLPTSPIDDYAYTRPEILYVWDWEDTGPSDFATDRMSLRRGFISSLGVASVDAYRFASGGDAVHLEHSGTMRVMVFAKRLAAHVYVDDTHVNPPQGSGPPDEEFPAAEIVGEVPTGVVNDVNTEFDLSETPSPASSLMLFKNGLLQEPGVDYVQGTASSLMTLGQGVNSSSDAARFPQADVVRVWDSGARWGLLNPSNGVYNWTPLDNLVATAKSKGAQLLYCFGSTPNYAAIRPAEAGVYGLGSASTPNMTYFQNFLTALSARNQTTYGGYIQMWEVWNEVNNSNFWTGTNAELLEMAEMVYDTFKAADPQCIVTTPTPCWGDRTPDERTWEWLTTWFGLNGHQFADVVTFHGYVDSSSPGYQPDEVGPIIDNIYTAMSDAGVDLPLWDTESGWDLNSKLPDADKPAWLQGWVDIRLEKELAMAIWYQWDNTTHGTMFASGALTASGTLWVELIAEQATSSAITMTTAPAVVDGIADTLYAYYRTDGDTTSWVDAETPAGSIPGSAFTLADTPDPTLSLLLFKNGLLLYAGGDGYTLAGTAITLVTALEAGAEPDALLAFYRVDGEVANHVNHEDLSSAIDGASVHFELADPPNPIDSLLLFWNGQLLTPGGVDYILSGVNITMASAPSATDADTLIAYYIAGTTTPDEEPPVSGDIFGNNSPASDNYTASTSVSTIRRNFDSSTSVADKSGNANVGNVSTQPFYRLLYDGTGAGVTVAPMMAIQPWWRKGILNRGHIDVGYDSIDPVQVETQMQFLRDREIDHGSIAWYGSANIHHDDVAQVWLGKAEDDGTFKVNMRVQKDAILPGITGGLSATNSLIAQLNYLEANFFQSSGYHKVGGRPLVLFFDVNTTFPDINWTTVRATISGYTNEPLLIFRNKGGYSQTESDGAFSWIDPRAADSDDRYGLGYLTDYNPTAIANPTKVRIASAYKGFDDDLATWGENRFIPQDNGNCFLECLRVYNQYWPIGAQADFILLPTMNDYEEGTAFEMGIANGVSVALTRSGDDINWTLLGDQDTIYRFNIYETTDSITYTPLDSVAVGVRTYTLSGLSAGTHLIYVEAEGMPFIQNKVSNGISYTV